MSTIATSPSNRDTHAGGCLCGAVRYEVAGPLRAVVFCHCTQCRRSTGHFLAATAARHRDFRLLAGEELRWYASSDSARRAFCGRCGSTLFWQANGRDYISIAAGTLDGPTGLDSACHIHVADKGDYYPIADGLPQSGDGNFSVAIPQR
ncbi:MAG TPA: GFA family protein [Steroidobacteraceae bacterium]|nr:GFA family protein [Steroidobacteraceae bacterium]